MVDSMIYFGYSIVLASQMSIRCKVTSMFSLEITLIKDLTLYRLSVYLWH